MISAVLITLNEERNLPDCFASLQWVDEIIVLDSHSTDRTEALARAAGAKVFQRVFTDYAEQKNEAISHASHPWVLMVDADERISPALAQEIQRILREDSGQAVYKIKRETVFLGHRLRWSGTQGDAPIRLIPKGKAHLAQPVHETVVTELPVKTLTSPMEHFTTRTMTDYRKKLEKYIRLEINHLKDQRRKVYFLDWLLRPAAKFFYLYILKLGIFDGWGGVVFCSLAAYYDFQKFFRYRYAS